MAPAQPVTGFLGAPGDGRGLLAGPLVMIPLPSARAALLRLRATSIPTAAHSAAQLAAIAAKHPVRLVHHHHVGRLVG